MAKLKGTAIASGISGSAGPITFVTLSNGTTIIRDRTTPSNPETPQQIAWRALIRRAGALWRTLSFEQAEQWRDYAAANRAEGAGANASGAFIALAAKVWQVDPFASPPLTPPGQVFLGDGIGVTVGLGNRVQGLGEIAQGLGDRVLGQGKKVLSTENQVCQSDEELRRIGRLATGNDCSPECLCDHSEATEGRDLRTQFPDPQSSSFDTGKHCRGIRPSEQEGVSPIPSDSQRQPGGTFDPSQIDTDALSGDQHNNRAGTSGRDRKNADKTASVTPNSESLNHTPNTLDPKPHTLDPKPYPLDPSPVITFTATGPNSSGVVTELLLQALPSRLSTPQKGRDRHKAVVTFTASSLSATVAVKPGAYAASVRFVKTATGQASGLVRVGIVDV